MADRCGTDGCRRDAKVTVEFFDERSGDLEFSGELCKPCRTASHIASGYRIQSYVTD